MMRGQYLVWCFLVLGIGGSFTVGHELDCDFNTNLCNWQNSEGQKENWRIEPTGEGKGILIFKPSWTGGEGVTTLQSPLLQAPPSADFRFTYWMVIGGKGTLRIRVQSYFANGTLTGERTVFERTKTNLGQHGGTVTINNQDDYFRLMVDAVTGDGFYGVFNLDDFRFEPTCDDNWCQHGGKCLALDDGTFGCDCPPGYTGTECQQYSPKHSLCNGVEMVVTGWPESITPYVSDTLSVKCAVDSSVSPPDTAECGDGSGESVFRAVMSVVLKKEDPATGEKVPIAMVSTYDPVKSYLSPEEGAVVDGRVKFLETLTAGEIAFLSVDWLSPDQSKTGLYSCQVSGLDTRGQIYEAEVRSEVIVYPATMELLGMKILELQKEITQLKTDAQTCAKP